jgi:predicted nuclease of predicted toxin-antitoxin system
VILWVDAQLSPALAPWITQQFGIDAYSVKWLGYRDATDPVIFQAAREAGAVVMTKDSDFLRLLERYGPPPQVLWVTLGNTSKPICGRFSAECCCRRWHCWNRVSDSWRSAMPDRTQPLKKHIASR